MFEVPSEIQKKAIIPMMLGRDVIGQAQSGSGKTATFTKASLHTIDLLKGSQILILAPTHELVKQIANVCESLGSNMIKLNVKTLVGGVRVSDSSCKL